MEKQGERLITFFTPFCSSALSLKLPEVLKHDFSKLGIGSAVLEFLLLLFVFEIFFCS